MNRHCTRVSVDFRQETGLFQSYSFLKVTSTGGSVSPPPAPTESLFYPNAWLAAGKAIASVNCHQISPLPVLLVFVVLFCASWESSLGYIVLVVCEKATWPSVNCGSCQLGRPFLLYNPLKIENLVELHNECRCLFQHLPVPV